MDESERGENERPDGGAVVRLYGEPFDSGLASAEEHQLAADLAAAVAVYEQLLALAESFEDSPDVRFLRAHLLANIASVLLTATDLGGAEDAVERSVPSSTASRRSRWGRAAVSCGWRSC